MHQASCWALCPEQVIEYLAISLTLIFVLYRFKKY